MFYDAELGFYRSLMQKIRVNILRLDPGLQPDRRIDDQLRSRLGISPDYERTFAKVIGMLQPNNIYRLTDQFLCSYLFLLLPDADSDPVMLVGPYMSVELTRQQLMEQAEASGIPPQHFKTLERFYSGVPIIKDENLIFAPTETLGERIWGSRDAFMITDINREIYDLPPVTDPMQSETTLENTLRDMQIMEARYAFENEFMQAVSQGQNRRVEVLLSGFSRMAFDRRLADPVRNMKNYCIVMNTLLRKAAEQGGVHPLYLDEQSSAFAIRIEEITSVEAVEKLMEEMYRTYCRLVRNNSTGAYSPPVQRAVIHINSDLSGDLSLNRLAQIQNINASYLSVLFKKETGSTITDYVNQKRVSLAAQLLSGSKLQIQTVAQYCGIADANYFSKVFKKYTGVTPKDFRHSAQTNTVSKSK